MSTWIVLVYIGERKDGRKRKVREGKSPTSLVVSPVTVPRYFFWPSVRIFLSFGPPILTPSQPPCPRRRVSTVCLLSWCYHPLTYVTYSFIYKSFTVFSSKSQDPFYKCLYPFLIWSFKRLCYLTLPFLTILTHENIYIYLSIYLSTSTYIHTCIYTLVYSICTRI